MEKVNKVMVSGVVSEKCKNYAILKWRRHSGQENIIRVWNFPEEFVEGEKVTISGELDARRIAPNSPKQVLGVKAKEVISGDRGDSLIFTGVVFAKGKRRSNFKGDDILNLIIKVNDTFCATCVAWNGVACSAGTQLKVGDKVSVRGLLLSREYKRNQNGIICPRLTTEVSITYIEKVE